MAIVCGGALARVSGQAAAPRVFTAAQADAGRIAIQQNSFGACTDCHGTSLTGRTGDPAERPLLASLPADYQKLIQGNGGRVPAFVGPSFTARWGTRSTKALIDEFEKRFAPPASRLSAETRLELIAYILQANGAEPGTQPLTMSTDAEIRALFSAIPPK